MIAAVSPETKNRFVIINVRICKTCQVYKEQSSKNEDTVGTNEALENQLRLLQQRNDELEAEVVHLRMLPTAMTKL